MDEDVDEDAANAEEPEQHPAKRQKLDTQEAEQEQPLDDEAVLALAAHNGATGGSYPEEYVLSPQKEASR